MNHFIKMISHFLLTISFILAASSCASAQRPTATPTTPKPATTGSTVQTDKEQKEGWSYDPDAGFVYRKRDFKAAIAGYMEGLIDPGEGGNGFRRARQSIAIEFPRFSKKYRTAFVYEVDFTDNNFFRAGAGRKVFENLFFAVQDAEDAGKFRALIGENTHIISREDNLSSGNLPTINRSLILEEHGSVNSFGTQFGVQFQKALSPRLSLALSAQDNRGSLNTDKPRYSIGNSLAAKLTGLAINDEQRGRKLTYGFGLDQTRDIRNRTFTLASAIAAEPLGGTQATGNKLSLESDLTYTDRIKNHSYTLEAEGLLSNFSRSRTNVGGGYAQAQISLFDSEKFGDLDPFLRHDAVRLSRDSINGAAWQQAFRAGLNYNLPSTRKLADLHVEYVRNRVRGASEIVPVNKSFNEFRFELRLSLTRYTRH